jgi:hypothetical protein
LQRVEERVEVGPALHGEHHVDAAAAAPAQQHLGPHLIKGTLRERERERETENKKRERKKKKKKKKKIKKNIQKKRKNIQNNIQKR